MGRTRDPVVFTRREKVLIPLWLIIQAVCWFGLPVGAYLFLSQF